ncbi:MAG: hypothetical protein AAFR68_14945 [Pseudomonadota bacterium]
MIKSAATALFCAFISFGASAEHAHVLDQFRAHLDAGDYDALEAAAAELLASPEGIAAYRAVSATLYRTTHPTRLETIEAWHSAMPKSSHALTAMAWSHIHLAYAGGLTAEGNMMSDHPNFEELQRARPRAIDLAAEAFDADAQNVSAVDAWMHTLSWTKRVAFFGLHSRRLVALAPTRESILSILKATPNNDRELAGVCFTHAEAIDNYGLGMCMIDVAYQRGGSRALKLDAANYLKSLPPDERFDYARVDEALYPTNPMDANGSIRAWPDDLTMENVDQLRQWFLNLDVRDDPQEVRRYATRIGLVLKNPEVQREMEDLALSAFEERLLDDPYNPMLLDALMEIHFERENYAELITAFDSILERGWYNEDAWAYGAISELWREDVDFDYGIRLLDIATAAFGNNIYSYTQSHYILHGALSAASPNSTGREQAECTLFRLARLATGLCDVAENVQHICEKEGHPAMIEIPKTLEQTSPDMCTDFRNMRLTDLRYKKLDLFAAAREIKRERRWRALNQQSQ